MQSGCRPSPTAAQHSQCRVDDGARVHIVRRIQIGHSAGLSELAESPASNPALAAAHTHLVFEHRRGGFKDAWSSGLASNPSTRTLQHAVSGAPRFQAKLVHEIPTRPPMAVPKPRIVAWDLSYPRVSAPQGEVVVMVSMSEAVRAASRPKNQWIRFCRTPRLACR